MTQARNLVLYGACYLSLALSAMVHPTAALSASVCDNTAATWVSESPRLEGRFPYYSLLFFCDGHLNLENRHVDACINHGSDCGQAAADEFCQYLGFEAATPTMFTTTRADAPTRSMTGEWCINDGNYQDLGYLNRTQLEAFSSTSNSKRCERLDSVTCYNSRDRLAQNNSERRPISDNASQSAQSAESSSSSSAEGVLAVSGPSPAIEQTAIGGRKLRRLL